MAKIVGRFLEYLIDRIPRRQASESLPEWIGADRTSGSDCTTWWLGGGRRVRAGRRTLLLAAGWRASPRTERLASIAAGVSVAYFYVGRVAFYGKRRYGTCYGKSKAGFTCFCQFNRMRGKPPIARAWRRGILSLQKWDALQDF